MNINTFETYRGLTNQFDIDTFRFLKQSSIYRILEEATQYSFSLINQHHHKIFNTKVLNQNNDVLIDSFSTIYVNTEINKKQNDKCEIIHHLFLDKSYLHKEPQLIISKSHLINLFKENNNPNKNINLKNNIFSAYKGIVRKSDCDQMSHMNVQFYFDKHSAAIKNLFNCFSLFSKKDLDFKVENERCIFSKEVHLGFSLEIIFSIKSLKGNELILLSKVFCIDNQNISAFFETRITFELFDNFKKIIEDIFLLEKNTYLNELNFEDLRELRGNRPKENFNKNAFISCKKAVNTWNIGFDGMSSSQFKIDCVSDAATHFFTACGADYKWRTKYKIGSAALDYSVRYFKDAPLGMAITMYTNFTDIGNKSLKFIHHMIDDASGDKIMDIEIVAVLFDLDKRVSIVVPDDFKKKAISLLIEN